MYLNRASKDVAPADTTLPVGVAPLASAGPAGPQQGTGLDHSYVADYRRLRDDLVPWHGWTDRPDQMWCYVQPPGVGLRAQGWKIHVSAVPTSAVEVLTAVARVLIEHRVAFKFASGLAQLRQLLSIRCDRGSGGKFITVYPDDDAVFTTLLPLLHEATAGMIGPAILSDKRYRPHSLVHYRYGGFTASQQFLDAEGTFAPVLTAPDGSLWADERTPWYCPPPWAICPLPDPEPVRPASERGRSTVRLDGRFVVHEAIRHSNRGGVYRALDERTGQRVVIKEARPHISAELDGTDARDYLRNEYETLRMLEPLGIATRPIALFDYQGHVFLAEEEVPGETLRAWVERLLRARPDWVMPRPTALRVARGLVELMRAVHDKGFVFRDFTANNVMVTPDDELVLIDTEFLAVPGRPVIRVQTVGYVAPEDVQGPARYPAPQPSADLYSIGATLFYLCTGAHPVLPVDGAQAGAPGAAPRRPHTERLAWLVEAMSAGNPTLRVLADLVCALMAEDPAARPSLEVVHGRLDAAEDAVVPPVPRSLSALLDDATEQRLLDDGIAEVVAAMTPRDPMQLWPAQPMEGKLFDPLALQAGSAGAMDVLRRAVARGGEDGPAEALRSALDWLAKQVDRRSRALPGLYFGRAGTYWAMYEAADQLGDRDLADRAVSRLKALPVVWGNPDVTHGVAGCGLAHLHLMRRTGGDDELAARVGLCVGSVLGVRSEIEGLWPVSGLGGRGAGLTHYGFAHGVAGICYFLLVAGQELDRPELVDYAVQGGDTLLSLAASSSGALTWPVAQPEADAASTFDGVNWWCSGGPGIGTFLLRLWRVTGDGRYLDAARGAAVATRSDVWLLSTSHCHGLAGNGEFLLDMAAATGEARYLDWAREHAVALHRLSALRDGRLLMLDDSAVNISYSYNLGLSGPLTFLDRLRHGGPRAWMVDDLVLRPEACR